MLPNAHMHAQAFCNLVYSQRLVHRHERHESQLCNQIWIRMSALRSFAMMAAVGCLPTNLNTGNVMLTHVLSIQKQDAVGISKVTMMNQ